MSLYECKLGITEYRVQLHGILGGLAMKEFKINHNNKITKEEFDKYTESYIKWKDDCKERAENDGDFNYQFFYSGFARAAKDAKLSGNSLIVYHAICELSWKATGLMDKPNEALAEYCGVKGGSLSDSLKQLEEKGFIIRAIYKDGSRRTVRAIQVIPYPVSRDSV